MNLTNRIVHRTREELEAGLDHIRQSLKDNGILHMIVRRPREFLFLFRSKLQFGLVWNPQGVLGFNHCH